jgi:CSLREA domain-containing protein
VFTRFRLASVALCFAFLFHANATEAATFTVTKTADTEDGACNSDCSLREAIVAANAAAGDDNIVFDATAFNARQVITLGGSQLPTITTNVSITGTDVGVILDGNGQSRVLEIGSTATVTLSKLTIRNGRGTLDGGIATLGGGIRSHGVLTLESCTVSDNSARYGGGIYSNTGASNKALTLRNSTVSGNRSTSEGAGIDIVNGKAVLESSTITRNVAQDGDTPRGGGGIYASQFSVTTRVEVHNSIIADNSGDDLSASGGLSSLYVSGGYNIVGFGTVTATNFGAPGDRRNAFHVGLSPLQDNGGPTFTHLPGPDSSPVNAGDAIPSVDQRGVARPFGTQDDIGAVEYVPTQPGPGFIVNATGDSDNGCTFTDCTLREAINAANANVDSSEIVFDPAVFGSRQTITLSTELPPITRHASILGPASGVTINGNGRGAFRVEAARVVLFALHVTGARRAIDNREGQITIRRCTFANSELDAFIQMGGQALLENSTFALNTNGSGAVANSGTLEVQSCTFTGNARGIRTAPGTTLTLSNTIAAGNTNPNDIASSPTPTVTNSITSGTAAQAGLETLNGGPF